MRKAGCFLTVIVFILMLLAVGKTSFAWECVGPETQNCLQCHDRTVDIHEAHYFAGITDCTPCHNGVPGTSPCDWGEPTEENPVETSSCNPCHGVCKEVRVRTNSGDYDCGQCHFPPGDPGDCAADIPTLSEWGMIIFITVMMGIGVVILRKRRTV